MIQERSVSELGIEMTLTINHFGHFYLTYGLFDLLKRSPAARILNMSSMNHRFGSQKMLDDLACEQNYDVWEQYRNSKLMNVMFAVGLHQLCIENKLSNIKSAAMNPGAVKTDFGADSGTIQCLRCILCCVYVEREQGAKSTLHLCRLPFEQIASGEYYDDDGKVKEMNPLGRDLDFVRRLWAASEKAYGIKFD